MNERDTARYEAARRMVNDHVLCCASTLIHELHPVAERIDDSETYYNLLAYTPEWRYQEVAEENGWSQDAEGKIVKVPTYEVRRFDAYLNGDYVAAKCNDGIGWRVWREGEDENLVTGLASREDAQQWLVDQGLITVEDWEPKVEDEADSWQEACWIDDLDVDAVEVYEHWIVSTPLALALARNGMLVETYLGLNIWGRTCTGQSIALDGDIQDIAEEWYGLEQAA